MRRFGSYTIINACLITGALLAACHQINYRHLVIDAGSSGSRYCVFQIKQNRVCRAPQIEANTCYKLPGGLADLNPVATYKQLNQGLHKTGFMTPDGSKTPTQSIALLGTGGFRRLNKVDRKKALTALRAYFQKKDLAARVAILSGEAEGRLAWYAMQEVFASRNHLILETGGATLQLAYNSIDSNPHRIKVLSTNLGMESLWNRLIRQPAFQVCHQRNSGVSYSKNRPCKTFLHDYLQKKQIDFYKFSKSIPVSQNRKIFALGSTWQAIFGYAGSLKITASDLEQIMEKYCQLSTLEIHKQGVPKKYAARACFILSFHSMLIDLMSNSVSTQPLQIQYGNESWPRGAAIHNSYFPHCRASETFDARQN